MLERERSASCVLKLWKPMVESVGLNSSDKAPAGLSMEKKSSLSESPRVGEGRERSWVRT
jgi:hypothetical protein